MADSGFNVWKEKATGLYRWLSIYSNNYRDDDKTPEIISAESHTRFVEMVNKGLVDYPELWLWHVPAAWGKADFVDYIDGFAIAGGYVYPGFEATAQSVAKEKNLATSHGMPEDLVLYAADDPTVIRFHITREISPLPHWAAANKRTGFVVLKGENEMPLSDVKREFLATVGKLPPEFIKSLEEQLDATAAEAKRSGIESKEVSGLEVETPAPAPVLTPEPVAVVATPEPVAVTDGAAVVKEVKYVTAEEVAGVLGEVVQALVASNQALAAGQAELKTQFSALTKEISDLKRTDAEKLKEVREVTPPMSLKEMVARNIIGNPATRIAEDSPLGNDGPKEKEAKTAPAVTPVPFVNGLISSFAQIQ